MILATFAMLVLIFGGGIWFQNLEKEYRKNFPKGDPAVQEYAEALTLVEKEQSLENKDTVRTP